MLVRLLLEQFVLVDRGELEFGTGLNVLTGETGAGKSILIDALGLLVGGRGTAEWVRRGARRLHLEGVFDLRANPEIQKRLSEAGVPLDEEELFIVRREIGSDGRNRSFANGRQVLVSQLREWTEGLVWIVGQGEQRALLTSAQQELLLDRFAGAGGLASGYRRFRREFFELRQRMRELERAREAFAAEEEWLEYQVGELESASIEPGEREELLARRGTLALAARNAERAEQVFTRLREQNGSVLDHLESLLHQLSDAGEGEWSPLRDGLLEVRERVRELIRAVPAVPEDVEGERERIDGRLSEIARLLRKHGDDEAAARAQLEKMRARLAEGRGLEEEIVRAGRELEKVREDLAATAEALSRSRQDAAERLSGKLIPELEALAMPGAALGFEFERQESPDGVGPVEGPRYLPLEGGLDKISVRFQSHEGLEWGDLGRVASGGELSRVLLAMQAVLGEGAPPATWVFDEIDQGIGGETARRVGERLARMAGHTQVLLVTHLPAIAALADRHLTVTKEETEDTPSARIRAVEGEDRLSELARMLSGDAGSKIARSHAEELLTSSAASMAAWSAGPGAVSRVRQGPRPGGGRRRAVRKPKETR